MVTPDREQPHVVLIVGKIPVPLRGDHHVVAVTDAMREMCRILEGGEEDA